MVRVLLKQPRCGARSGAPFVLRGFAIVIVVIVLLAISVAPAEAQVEGAFVVDAPQMVKLSENWLEQRIFGNRQGDGARARAETALDLEVALIEQIGNLTEAQKDKLELAGLGDIHRFFNRVEVLRRSAPTGQMPMQQYQELMQKAQPLQRRFGAGLHGNGSLFHMTVQSTLDEHQLETFRRIDGQRRRKQYEAIVRATVAQIDQAVPLTSDQRTRLIELVLTETDPPETYVASQYQYHVVLLNMSKFPEEDLRSIFLENEWQVIQRLLQHGRLIENQLRQAQDADDE